MATPQDIPLVPVSPEKFSSLRTREDVVTPRGSMPILGDDFNSPDKSYVYVGKCDKFNLSDDSERGRYAALSAKLYAGNEYLRLWEERIQTSEDIVVYVSYIQVMQVRTNGTENFDLEDKQNV